MIDKINDMARQYSRRPEEAADLVQELFLEAVRTGRDITGDEFMPWARGVLRNRAAFIARTEGRRRKRESDYQTMDEPGIHKRVQFPEDFISELSPSLRITARLINCTLNKQEIAYLLQIGDAALRQRFTALRKQWQLYLDSGGEGPEYTEEINSPFHNGLMRRSLIHSFVIPRGRAVGTHDPDGHLFIVRSVSAHKKPGGGNNTIEGDT